MMTLTVKNQAIFAVFFAAVIAVFFIYSPKTTAHENLHEQILQVTKEIKRDSKNPALYLKRAELYRLHREWKNAENDFKRAERLNPNLAIVDFGRGKLRFDARRFAAAKIALERFIAKEPNSFEAVLTLARVLSRLGETENAVEYYARAIRLAPADSVEIFLERAQILTAKGKIDEAVRGLDEGIAHFSNLPVLQTAAIDLEIKRKRYEAALARLEKLSEPMPRKEGFLLKRGEILLKAGKKCRARQAFNESLKAIESLPDFRKNARAVQTMKIDLQKLIEQSVSANCK